MDEWVFQDDHEDSYEYGYEYIQEEKDRLLTADGEESEEEREEWWEDEPATAESEPIPEDTGWSDDDAADEDSHTQSYAEILAEVRAEEAEHQADSSAVKAKKQLVREMKAEALSRLERGARTVRDFKAVTEAWDHLDQNRERWERDHEILSDEPDSGTRDFSRVWTFPRWRCDPTERQIISGNFLDYLYDCPYEMHDLVTRKYMIPCIKGMKDEHKEILYFLYLRQFTPQHVAEMRGQTDRNIRKVRNVALRKLRKKVYRALSDLAEKGSSHLTGQEREFMKNYEAKRGANKK